MTRDELLEILRTLNVLVAKADHVLFTAPPGPEYDAFVNVHGADVQAECVSAQNHARAFASGMRPGRVRESSWSWLRIRQVSEEKRSRAIDAMCRIRSTNSRTLPSRVGW